MEGKNIIEWKDEYSVGVKVFDTHHKTLFQYINEFYQDVYAGANKTKIKKHLNRFTEYADFHLKAEEEMFDKYEYPGKKEHVIEHENYRKEVKRFLASNRQDIEFYFGILEFLKDWWLKHVMVVDKKYEDFFAGKI